MHRSLSKLPSPINFPEYMAVSNNYYKSGWSLNTHRRVKNVIVWMEWIPSLATLRPRSMHDMKGNEVLGPDFPERETKLRHAIQLFDTNNSGRFDCDTLREFLLALDVVVTGLDMKTEMKNIASFGETRRARLTSPPHILTHILPPPPPKHTHARTQSPAISRLEREPPKSSTS
jgi:hypothetical protein